jgi:3-oxoadipate enol-lactonase
MATVDTILGPVFIDDQGKPDQPTALLWPSLFTDHRMWRHQIAALQDAGWRTITLDPPGHGQSPGPGRGFTMDECAQAAIQVLDATGVDKPVLYLGTSWGGFVAPRIAISAPERISGMVLFNTSAERGNAFERMRASLLTKLMAIGRLDNVTVRLIVAGLLAPETRRRSPEIGDDLAQQMRTWDRRRFITTVRSVLLDRVPVLDELAEVKVPTLVVSGGEDHTLPSVHSRRIAEHLPGARHVVVPNAAHLVALEKPQEANSLIFDFVRELPTAQ